jgi:hypothetical protein
VTTKKRLSLLKTIVSLAAPSSKGRLCFPKRKTADTARKADHRRALKDHVEHLAHMQCLAKQELEQVERLSFEIEQQMGETMRSLTNSLF